MSKRNNHTWPYYLYFFLFAGGMGVYISFINVYLDALGYTRLQIGLLSAVAPAVALLAQPGLSLVAERSAVKNRVLLVLLVLQVGTALLHIAAVSWPLMALAMALLTTVQGAALALGTAIILQGLKARGQQEQYGGVRLAYSAGYALAGAAAGILARWGWVYVFAFCALLSGLAWLGMKRLPPVQGYQSRGQRVGLRALWGYREFCVLIGYCLLLHSTSSLATMFLPLYFKQLGASHTLYGWSVFVLAAAEAPFLLLGNRLMRRIPVRVLLMVPGVVLTARWLLTAHITQPLHLLAANSLHGLSNIVIYYTMARYIEETLPKEVATAGQGVFGAVVMSGARIVGALAGGLLSRRVELGGIFVRMGVVTCVAVALLGVYNLLRHHKHFYADPGN